jgi:hypothetical protein
MEKPTPKPYKVGEEFLCDLDALKDKSQATIGKVRVVGHVIEDSNAGSAMPPDWDVFYKCEVVEGGWWLPGHFNEKGELWLNSNEIDWNHDWGVEVTPEPEVRL